MLKKYYTVKVSEDLSKTTGDFLTTHTHTKSITKITDYKIKTANMVPAKYIDLYWRVLIKWMENHVNRLLDHLYIIAGNMHMHSSTTQPLSPLSSIGSHF